jgi:hypothetical protein
MPERIKGNQIQFQGARFEPMSSQIRKMLLCHFIETFGPWDSSLLCNQQNHSLKNTLSLEATILSHCIPFSRDQPEAIIAFICRENFKPYKNH